MKLKPAICPVCGAGLELSEKQKIVECKYCGKKIVVSEAINMATRKIENLLTIAKNAMSAGNFEEAYNYFTKVLELDPQNYEAWLGKGESAGWQSTLANFRLPEVIMGFENALKFCPQDKIEDIKQRGAAFLDLLAMTYLKLNLEHFFEFGRFEETREECYSRFITILDALTLAHAYAPPFEKQILEHMILVCQIQIEGISYKDFGDYGECIRVSYLSPDRESMLKDIMNKCIKKMKAIDPSFEPPTVEKKHSCFIVTATMGNENHPYVILLRDFRDQWLSKRSFGNIFIKYYYRFSPQFADFIRRIKILQRISYVAIVKPSVKVAKKLLQQT